MAGLFGTGNRDGRSVADSDRVTAVFGYVAAAHPLRPPRDDRRYFESTIPFCSTYLSIVAPDVVLRWLQSPICDRSLLEEALGAVKPFLTWPLPYGAMVK